MRADRLLAIMLRLQLKGKHTAAELAAELNVTQRTIYRDIDVLSASGVPIYADGGPGGGYRLLDSYRTSLTGLNENEIQSLFMLAVPNQVGALSEGHHLNSAFLKLATALPQRYQDQIRQTEQRLYLDSRRWFQGKPATPHLKTIQQAVWEDRQIEIGYSRQNDTTNRRMVEPYALGAKSGNWYLVAHTPDGMRVFRVSRIFDVVVSAESFTRAPDFDLPTYWQQWTANYEASLPSYPVTIRVTAAGESRLIQQFGDGVKQVLDSAENQAGWKTISLNFEREEEAHAFLIGIGNTVSILQPDSLRQKIIATAQEILDHYQS